MLELACMRLRDAEAFRPLSEYSHHPVTTSYAPLMYRTSCQILLVFKSHIIFACISSAFDPTTTFAVVVPLLVLSLLVSVL